jgi:hypothetical protein
VVSPLPKPPKANTTSGLLIESACGGAGSIRRPEPFGGEWLRTRGPADSQSTSEGKPGAATPAWVFERSPEGESEIPRVSEGRDAEANARWSRTGLPERPHRLRGGRSLVAGLFRRRLLRRFKHQHSGEKLERSSSSHRPLRLVARWCGLSSSSSTQQRRINSSVALVAKIAP